jgi:diguanylate cyclase (GGDEF)-like protein
MSFRGRLRLFFALIVIVPMIALGIVLSAITARSETGKADAGIAAGVRTAVGVYNEEAARAQLALDRVARDPRLRRVVARGQTEAAARRLRDLARGDIVAAELWAGRERVAGAGSSSGVVAAGSDLVTREGSSLILTVSVTPGSELVRRVAALTGLDASVSRGGRTLASTLEGRGFRFPPPGDVGDFEIRGEEYRGKFVRMDGPAGPAVALGIFSPRVSLSEQIADNRLLIAVLLALFVLFALAFAGYVSRALTRQIATFLEAARRLSRGDFRRLVATQGNDEFAALGREFNDMSVQLEAKIEEVERKREELAETIRRVGDALATGLDRHGVVALAVRQAVDGCNAEAARALPLAHGVFRSYEVGELVGELEQAVETAERRVFAIHEDVGEELLGALEGDEGAERTRRAVAARFGEAHAVSIGLRSLVDGPEYLGAISIARYGAAFSREEEELLEYLAGQAVISIENASLHETVARQARTDELTGLANVRAFVSIVERELERSRRFDTPLALVMVDIDDFKEVNDSYGHQQGDEVLAHIAEVLRTLSRELDAPARYGGEELAVVLPQTDAAGAQLLAERMREAVQALQVPRIRGRGTLSVTASFGVASVPESARDRDELIAAADAALYRAKRAGKNRVERAPAAVAEPSSPPR